MLIPLKIHTLLVAASIFVSNVQCISKVTRKGRYLYTEDSNRFFIKGIAYQEQGQVVQSADNDFGEPSSFIDPLSIGDACQRDLPFLQQLQVNTIRVYSVDSSLNHDACMSAFSNAGIYTIIDLALPLNGSIDRVNPSWSTNILNQYIKTIDAFSKYDNVLAYNVGNEVVIQNNTNVAPFVKAAARDIKAYLASKGSSALVGYAAINGAAWRVELANYLSCDPQGTNSDSTSIDLYGLNDYEWCGDSTFEQSYAGTESAYSQYNVAAYFSEFGCITSPPRLWTEAVALLGSNMSDVWSGGIAFSYFPASSVQGQFGMVTISADNKTVTTSADFDKLKTEYGLAAPPNSPSMSTAAAAAYPSCAAPTTDFIASNTLPPTPNDGACNCLESTLSCQFIPATSNYSAIVGQLIDVACSLVGQKGGSCTDIGVDGQAGVYGRVSDCDPTIKLSFIMSQNFELNNRDPQACSFSGNGTVNPLAPTSVSAANAAASSCVSNPGATFTPSAPASSGSSSGSTTGGSNSASSRPANSSGAISLADNMHVMAGIVSMGLVTMISAIWTLS